MTITGFPDDEGDDDMPHEQDPTHPEGVSGDEQALRPRERKANAALEMRLMGYQWDEIAEVVGYPDAQRAQVAFENALEKQLADDPDSRKALRQITSRRYERLLRGVWKKALDPENAEQMIAQRRALDILAAQAKLLGLDAPAEVVIHAPTNTMLQEWVSGVLSKGNTAEEGDIFGPGVIEAEWEEVDDEQGDEDAVSPE